ncbi:MAG TPA: GxxExxY protein, partial [Verrucomicrobiae bacterium]|nr:GxxExxY protein [Verrucomicrobiae bacterium]
VAQEILAKLRDLDVLQCKGRKGFSTFCFLFSATWWALQLAKVHSKQVLTQLRLSGHRPGLLLNFGEVRLKHGIEQIVNGLPDEKRTGIVARLTSFLATSAAFA